MRGSTGDNLYHLHSPMNSKLKIISFINAHKILVPPIVLGMMYWFQDWSTEAFVYLTLHGTYAILWIAKSSIYPDRSFERRLPFWIGASCIFLPMVSYYLPAYLLLSRHVQLQPWVVSAAICCYAVGMFLHFAADAQKHYTLRFRPGLIEDGFFGRSRNPNYLGEILIYLAYAIVSWHWLSFVMLGAWCFYYFSNMRRKDRSLARYPGFAAYKARTGMLLPALTRTLPLEPLTPQPSQALK
jgi:protein-S-isoprenylcysteine O-methyltransferase Ste14